MKVYIKNAMHANKVITQLLNANKLQNSLINSKFFTNKFKISAKKKEIIIFKENLNKIIK